MLRNGLVGLVGLVGRIVDVVDHLVGGPGAVTGCRTQEYGGCGHAKGRPERTDGPKGEQGGTGHKALLMEKDRLRILQPGAAGRLAA